MTIAATGVPRANSSAIATCPGKPQIPIVEITEVVSVIPASRANDPNPIMLPTTIRAGNVPPSTKPRTKAWRRFSKPVSAGGADRKSGLEIARSPDRRLLLRPGGNDRQGSKAETIAVSAVQKRSNCHKMGQILPNNCILLIQDYDIEIRDGIAILGER